MKKLLSVLVAVSLVVCSLFSVACTEKKAVNVKYYSAASDMLPELKSGKISIGLLPEPAATKLTKMASDKEWHRLNLGELYDAEAKAYPQAVMLVKESLLNSFPELELNIKNTFNANAEWVKNNPQEAVDAVNAKLEEGVPKSLNAADITADVVVNCGIGYQTAVDSKNAVTEYISGIVSLDEKSAKEVTDDFFYGGTASGEFSKDSISVFMPDGAPALAMAKYVKDGENFGTGKTFNYTVVAASNIGGKVQKGAGDIVIIPVNAASKLYKANAADPYKMVAVVTHGNLFVMSTEKISVKDLAGKTIGIIGQGLVPDLTFRSVLSKNNLTWAVAA